SVREAGLADDVLGAVIRSLGNLAAYFAKLPGALPLVLTPKAEREFVEDAADKFASESWRRLTDEFRRLHKAVWLASAGAMALTLLLVFGARVGVGRWTAPKVADARVVNLLTDAALAAQIAALNSDAKLWDYCMSHPVAVLDEPNDAHCLLPPVRIE